MNADEIFAKFQKCELKTMDAYRDLAASLVREQMERNMALKNVLARIESESTEEQVKRIARNGLRDNDASGNVFAA